MSPSITTHDGTVILSMSDAELALSGLLDVFEMALDEKLPRNIWLLRLENATERAYRVLKRTVPTELIDTMRAM
jgi:hypothetical protein